MGLKTVLLDSHKAYIDFLEFNQNIRITNTTPLGNQLCITYMYQSPKRRHTAFIGLYDEVMQAKFHAHLPMLADHLQDAEVTVISTGSKCVYKVTGFPVEGSNWQDFMSMIHLTKV